MSSDTDQLTSWIQREQECLWDDLDCAIRNAMNGHWSIEAANTAGRILSALALVGPTPPERVPWRLLAGDVYMALLKLARVPMPRIADEQWSEWDQLMAEHGGRRAELQERYLPTRAAMNAPREVIYMRGVG